MLKSTIKRINEYESPYDEKIWFSIERKLNQKKRNKKMLFLFMSIALLIGCLYLYNYQAKYAQDTEKEYIPMP